MGNFSVAVNGTEGPTDSTTRLYWHSVLLACVWLLASVLGIAGNSLVIASVLLSRRVRTVTNAFVINLAAADLWTSLSYPWEVVAILSRRGWPLDWEFPCILAAVQLYTGLGASLYSLAMIALNRFMLVTRSRAVYRRCYSTGGIVAMIAATWLAPFTVYLLPLALGIGEIGYDPQDKTCSDKDLAPGGPEYNLIQSMGMYPLPMLVIIASYAALYLSLKRHFRQQKRSYAVPGPPGRPPAPAPVPVPSDGAPLGQCTLSFAVDAKSAAAEAGAGPGAPSPDAGGALASSRRAAISRQQLAITKNLFLVFCVFSLLLSPYFISLAVPGGRQVALGLITVSIWNSCVNPVIYTASHPIFKPVLRKMLLCRFSEIPEPSDWLKSLLSRRA